MVTHSKDPWSNSPWGKPPGGGNSGGSGGGNRPPTPPNPQELEEMLRRSQERLRKLLSGGGGGGNGTPSGNAKNSFMMLGGGLAVLWVLSGFFLVKADELGVISRFGAFNRTTPPGLHYHLPFPMEVAQTPKVTTVNRTEVGFVSSGRGGKPISKPEESLMLTKDENIVDIQFEVQWRIGKAEDYLFNLKDPQKTVKSVAESAMREAVGRMDIISVLGGGEGKLEVEQHTRRLMQEMLDNYKSGVEIVAINLTQPEPPAEVLDAWRDVQSARVDMETERNKALAYRNDIIPRARGQAEQILQEAEAYKQQVVAQATGESARFKSIYTQYQAAPDATAKRMYIETMEDVLKNMQKVIIDGKAGSGALPFLPLNDLKPKQDKATEAKP
jgi:modulator of FtsH protease HflK